LLENLISQGKIEKKIFSLYLSNKNGDSNSRLILGGIDVNYIDTKSVDSIIYANLSNI
jgi:hypothetical protein